MKNYQNVYTHTYSRCKGRNIFYTSDVLSQKRKSCYVVLGMVLTEVVVLNRGLNG